jgi:hypothetical protein
VSASRKLPWQLTFPSPEDRPLGLLMFSPMSPAVLTPYPSPPMISHPRQSKPINSLPLPASPHNPRRLVPGGGESERPSSSGQSSTWRSHNLPLPPLPSDSRPPPPQPAAPPVRPSSPATTPSHPATKPSKPAPSAAYTTTTPKSPTCAAYPSPPC